MQFDANFVIWVSSIQTTCRHMNPDVSGESEGKNRLRNKLRYAVPDATKDNPPRKN